MEQTFDAIIIGGGIHGVSTAFHLAQRGIKSLVIEKSTLASQATGRSSGMIRMHYDLEPESHLAWESFQYFRNWKEIVGGDCGFTRTGFIQIAKSGYMDHLKANIKMNQEIGIPSLLITGSDVERLAPYFKTDDIEYAAFEPESGYADPSAATMSMMSTARSLGAQLMQDCEVNGILIKSGKVIGVNTPLGELYTPIVVNAAGAWSGYVSKLAEIDVPIDTWRHDVLFVKRPREMGNMHPAVIDDTNEMYFRPETGGLTLIGLEDDNPIGESPDGFTDRAQPGFVERAIERICKRIPMMENGTLHSDHGGYDGISPDLRAVIGQYGPEGFYLQCGFSGTGFKIAPAVGACISELILDGEAKTIDITPFTPKRFEEGKMLKGEYSYDSIWH